MKNAIKQLAQKMGFDAIGFSPVAISNEAQAGLRAFLADGHHGDMAWMADKADRRADPALIMPEAKTIIVLGHNYGPPTNPLSKLEQTDRGVISVYALGKDYHDVIKKRLKALAGILQNQYGGEFKVFVDTAPIMEKPVAAQAGLGWQGKHTCLVSREFGSWLFLGEIFTTLDIPPDLPVDNHCGSCSSCLDICPTQAFPAPGKLDARRCISYLTIEHKGHIDEEFRRPMGNRIYGCDDCLAVCPWNKFASIAHETAYHSREALQLPLLKELARLDDAAFRQLFAGSPVKRTGRDRFIRNVLIALGNSGDMTALDVITPLLKDTSPLVRAMAVWASCQLMEKEKWLHLSRYFLPQEMDEYVIKEWQKGITHG